MTVRMRQPYVLGPGYGALPNIGSLPIPINLKDPIMDLYVRMYATNGGTSNVSNNIIDVLAGIDVIDGSDVLFSLDAEEIMALSYYHYKESISMGIDERPDVVQSTTFKIPFGIGRMHPELALDPKQFNNPTIVLHWNLNGRTAMGATGFLTNTLYVSIMADVIDEAPSPPTGFLMHKQIREYTTPVSGTMPTVLPSDYAYRTLFVRSFLADTCPKILTTKAKHDLNEDKYIPFEIMSIDWMEWLKEWYGVWHQGYWYFVVLAAAETRNPYLRGNLSASITASATATEVFLASLANCQLNINSAGTGSVAMHVKADGSNPFETFAWPYGDPDDPEEWLQIEDTDKSRLRLTHGPDAGKAYVFLTQHRTY